MPERSEYRIIEGGAPRAYKGAVAKQNIEREQHGLVVVATDEVSTKVPAEHRDWAYDLRRGRMRIYGSLLRFIDLLHRRGFSKETALMIPGWLTYYIEETWSDEPNEQRVPVQLDRHAA